MIRNLRLPTYIYIIMYAFLSTYGLVKLIVDHEVIYCMAALVPIAIILMLKNPIRFPLAIYFALLPFDNVLLAAEGKSITGYIGIISIVMLVIGLKKCRYVEINKSTIWWLLFILWGAISLIWSIDPSRSALRLPTAIGYLILYVVVSLYIVNNEDIKFISKSITVGGVITSIYCFITVNFLGTGMFHDTQRATLEIGDAGTDPNQLSFSLLIPFALSLQGVLSASEVKHKTVWGACTLMLFYTVLYSGSRGGLLGTIAILLIMLLITPKKSLIIYPIIAVLLLIFIYSPQEIITRITNDAAETGGAGRLGIWPAALEALKDNIILGTGLDTFPITFNQYISFSSISTKSAGAHNIYLCFAVELGIVGLTLMLIAIYQSLKLLKGDDISFITMKAACCGILVSSFFLDVVWKKPFWLLWMLIIITYNNKTYQNTNCAKQP